MDIIYVSRLTSERLINKIYKESGKNPGFAIQKLSRLLVRGLVKNGVSVKALSSPPINRSNSNKWVVKSSYEEEGGVEFTYLPVVNIPVLKSIVDFLFVFSFIVKWSKKKDEKKAVLFDVLNISSCLAGLLACRITKVMSVGIVTDLPGLLYGRKSSIKGKVSSFINNSYLHSFDKYVFITEQMNIDINKKSRPYIIMEGIVDSSMAQVDNSINNKNKPREILYAGGLYERFGLKMLIDAVKSLRRDDIRLVLYGDGPMANIIKDDNSPSIEYRGVAPNQEVVIAETRASLLVNPRPTHEAFTRYSFPSKNMEYMMSGTPILTTCLPGMPHDYYQYVFMFEEESVSGYAKKILEVFSLSDEALNNKGKNARAFVLNSKNEVKQGQRIIELISKE